jgi:O-antigen ligase
MEGGSKAWANTRFRLGSPWVRQFACAVLLAVFLGLAVIRVPALLILAAIAGVLAVFLAYTRPEAMILVLIGLTTELIPARFNPYLRLGGRGLFASDLMILLLFGVFAFRLLADRGFTLRRTPLNLPMLFFAGAVGLGMFTALKAGTAFSFATQDARIFLYYTAFFVVINLIRTKQQLLWLTKGLLFAGGAVAVTMTIQALLGQGAGLVDQSQLFTETTTAGSVVRFYAMGTVAAYVTFMVALATLALEGEGKWRALAVCLLLITGASVVLTLDRNLLISTSISVLVLLFLARRLGWSRLGFNLLLVLAVGFAGLLVLAATGLQDRLLAYIPAFSARLASLFGGAVLAPTETLGWRLQELHFAWPILQQHPLTGVGLDTNYRPAFFFGDTLESYTENAYVGLWLKTGLPGLLAFSWFSIAFLVRGFRNWQKIPDRFLRATTLGFTLAFLALAASDIVTPFFIINWSMLVLPVTFGINELTYRLAMDSTA